MDTIAYRLDPDRAVLIVNGVDTPPGATVSMTAEALAWSYAQVAKQTRDTVLRAAAEVVDSEVAARMRSAAPAAASGPVDVERFEYDAAGRVATVERSTVKPARRATGPTGTDSSGRTLPR